MQKYNKKLKYPNVILVGCYKCDFRWYLVSIEMFCSKIFAWWNTHSHVFVHSYSERYHGKSIKFSETVSNKHILLLSHVTKWQRMLVVDDTVVKNTLSRLFGWIYSVGIVRCMKKQKLIIHSSDTMYGTKKEKPYVISIGAKMYKICANTNWLDVRCVCVCVWLKTTYLRVFAHIKRIEMDGNEPPNEPHIQHMHNVRMRWQWKNTRNDNNSEN